jgi:MATE family multidrug resistance protein
MKNTATPVLNRRIWMLAWPLLLSNLTAPLLSLVDTAVVGHLDSPRYLAAVAMGGNYFMFLYFSFNFLRMGTTGFTAQARGGSQSTLIVICRALLLAAVLGGLLIAINPWLRDLGLLLLGGSDEVQTLAAQYINIRILGAPAALANFALIGFAIGVQQTRVPFKMTLLMHGSNAVLSYSLVYIWHYDVGGVAAASAMADYLGLFAALYWLRGEFNPQARREALELGLLRLQPMLQLVAVNRDLFIRSLALLSVFFFFTAQGARLGDTLLAANAVLITFLLILSNLLDGFANAAEALVGEAVGAKDQPALHRSVKATGLWSGYIALGSFVGFLLLGAPLINLLTDLDSVREVALEYLPWMLALPFTASLGFWLDGVFVGATRAHDMRNTMLVSVAMFFLVWWLARPLGNHGLWLAMNALMLTRGLLMALVWWHGSKTGTGALPAATADNKTG